MAIIEFGEPSNNTLAWAFFFIGGGLAMAGAFLNLFLLRGIHRNVRAVCAGRTFVAISGIALALHGTVDVIKLGMDNILSIEQVAIYCGGALLWLLIAGVELEERWEDIEKHTKAKAVKQAKRRKSASGGDSDLSTPPTTTSDPLIP